MLHLARHSAFTPQDLQKMMGFSVGFDSIFDRFFDMDLSRDTGYPPYNIRKIDESQYVIEFALAGFSKEDIEGMRETLHESEWEGLKDRDLREILWEGCIGWKNIPDAEVVEHYQNIYGESSNYKMVQGEIIAKFNDIK